MYKAFVKTIRHPIAQAEALRIKYTINFNFVKMHYMTSQKIHNYQKFELQLKIWYRGAEKVLNGLHYL